MKSIDKAVPIQQLTSWSGGAVTTGVAGQDVTYVTSQFDNTHGDFKTPNPFSYKVIRSSGLRGRTVRLDAAQLAPGNAIAVIGGLSSMLDQKGRLGSQYGFGTPNWDAAYNSAVSALSSAVRGDLDWSINVFQFKQTLESARRFLRLTETLRRSWDNARRRQGPHKEAANLYLEWTYGVAPVVSDLLTTLKKIQDKGLAGGPLVHYRGRGKVVDEFSTTQVVNLFRGIEKPVRFRQTSSYRRQLDIYLKPELSTLQQVGGYTSLNPVSWLYEMTPYSFVLDWVWNLGGFMRSMETAILHRARFHSGTDTGSLKQETMVDQSGLNWSVFSTTGLNGYHVFRGMDRLVLSSFPIPRLPSLHPEIGSKRILNAGALLSQFLPDMFDKIERGPRRDWRKLLPLGKG